MAKEASKKAPSKTGIEAEIESEGFSVFATFRDVETGAGVTLKLHRRAANALTALLGATDNADEESTGTAVVLRGELTILQSRASNENDRPSTVSGS